MNREEKKKGIVYVDDDEVMLYIFKRNLDEFYNIHTTTDPYEALKLIKRDDISIIVSDHAMPEMSGIELLEEVLKVCPNKGRILVTGNDHVEVVKEAINKAEINQFISKPWDEDNLKFAVDRVSEVCNLKMNNNFLQQELKKTVDLQQDTMLQQKKVIRLNQNVIKKLNRSDYIKEGRLEEGIIELTETLSKSMDISRVSVWSYNSKLDEGECIDLFCNVNIEHRTGYKIDKVNYEGITEVIQKEWVIQEENVWGKTSSKLPSKEYLKKFDIHSILYIPFHIGREVYGVLACEQIGGITHWTNDEVQFMSSVTDIIKLLYRTYERKLVEKELKMAYDELQATHSQLVLSEKMASLGQLTAGIAHEINNPINFVYAGINALDIYIEKCLAIAQSCVSCSLVGQGTDEENEIMNNINKYDVDELKEDIRLLVKDIRIGATRTAEIVKGLKNFSRLDEAESKISDIHEGLDSTLVLLRSQMTYANVEVVKKYDSSIPVINCYPGQLNQVFMNILSNAIQAMEDKGKIEVVTRNKTDKVVIEISDTGKGIPENIINNIFDPFYTTKDVGVGTGLGLSISYGIIEKHNGDIKAESIEGKGSKFTITLPK